MMTLLSEEYNKRIVEIDKEIDKIQTQLLCFKTHSAFTEHENSLKVNLDKFIKNILLQKDKKFCRDKLALKEWQAYKWNQSFSNMRRKQFKQSKNDQEYATSNVSSNSSTSFSSQPFRKKKAAREKNKQYPQGDGSLVRSPKKRMVDIPFRLLSH